MAYMLPQAAPAAYKTMATALNLAHLAHNRNYENLACHASVQCQGSSCAIDQTLPHRRVRQDLEARSAGTKATAVLRRLVSGLRLRT